MAKFSCVPLNCTMESGGSEKWAEAKKNSSLSVRAERKSKKFRCCFCDNQ